MCGGFFCLANRLLTELIKHLYSRHSRSHLGTLYCLPRAGSTAPTAASFSLPAEAPHVTAPLRVTEHSFGIHLRSSRPRDRERPPPPPPPPPPRSSRRSSRPRSRLGLDHHARHVSAHFV